MDTSQLSAQLSALAEEYTPKSVYYLILATPSTAIEIRGLLAGCGIEYFDAQLATPDHQALFWARVTPNYDPSNEFPGVYVFESGVFQRLSPDGKTPGEAVSCNGYFTASMIPGHTIGQVNVSFGEES